MGEVVFAPQFYNEDSKCGRQEAASEPAEATFDLNAFIS